MIVLKISNPSELVVSKPERFVERVTPDQMDNSIVEDLIVKKIKNLSIEWIEVEVLIAQGINLEEDKLVIDNGFNIRTNQQF